MLLSGIYDNDDFFSYLSDFSHFHMTAKWCIILYSEHFLRLKLLYFLFYFLQHKLNYCCLMFIEIEQFFCQKRLKGTT